MRIRYRKEVVLTPDQENYVRSNYKEIPVRGMSKAMNVSYDKVYVFMRQQNLVRKQHSTRSNKYLAVPDGKFNVMERENWIV